MYKACPAVIAGCVIHYSTIERKNSDMKTHLPVALRKALIAAIFAVSFVSYSTHAEESPQPVSYGDITTKDTSISASGSVSVSKVTDTADNLSITAMGDVAIGTIQTAEREAVDSLVIKAGGDLTIGESGDLGNGDEESRIPATITNADITTGGDFTIGETIGSSKIFTISGTESASSTVEITVGGDFVVNQSTIIHPGGGSGASGDLTLTADGNINFLGRMTNILGGGQGSEARATLISNTGSILVKDADNCTIGEGAALVAMGTDGNVRLQNNTGSHSIAGDIRTAGEIEVTGVYNYIDSMTNQVEFYAGQGITITSKESDDKIAYNGISHAVMVADKKGITITSEPDTYGNYITASSLTASNDDITIAGGAVSSVAGSELVAVNGEVSISGGAASVEDSSIDSSGSVTIVGTNPAGAGTGLTHVDVKGKSISVGGDSKTNISAHEGGKSTLEAADNVLVTGTNVAISDDTSITSATGDVDITATSGKVAVTGGEVKAVLGAVSIGGSTETGLSGVAVQGASIAVGSGTGSTVIGSDADSATTLNAAGDITVKDARVSIEADSVITSAAGDVEIAATEDKLVLTGGSVTTGDGDISISGATGTSVSDVAVSASGSGAGAVTIGQSDAGATIVEDSSIAADGQVSVLGASVEVKDSKGINTESSVVIAAGNGDVAMSGESVNAGKDVTVAAVNGDVSIASEVKSVEGSVAVSAGTDNTIDSAIAAGSDVTVTAGGNNTLSAEVTSGGEIAISAGAMNSIAADVKAANGSVAINGGTANVVEGTETTVAATNGAVQLSGGVNLVDGATLDASGETSVVSIAGESNVVRDGASIQADAGVSISSTGQETQSGNLISASSVQSADGDIVIKSENINRVSASSVQAEGGGVSLSGGVANVVEGSETKVSATGGSVELKGGAVVNNQVDGATLEATGEGGAVSIAGASNVICRDAAVQGEAGVSISSTGTDSAAGNVISGSVVASSSGDVAVGAANINLVDSSALESSAGAVTLAAESNLVRNGSTVESADGIAIAATGEGEYSGNGVSGARLHAAGGSISVAAEMNNHVSAGSAITADAGSVALSGGVTNVVEDSTLSAGADVNLTAMEKNEVSDSTVSAGADVTMVAAENVVAAVDSDTTVKAAGSVSLQGDNAIYSAGAQTSIVAEQGDITVAGCNDINRAGLQAGGAVRVTTGEGDMTTRVENASLTGSSVTIAGDTTSRDTADLAVVTGEDMLVTAGSITLNNVSVVDTGASSICATEDGDISILDRVDMQNATLTAAGHIVVDAGHVLNAGQGSSLQGRLSGSGDINKSGGDALVLSGDNTAFSGSIYANGAVGGAAGSVVDEENAGSRIEMSGAGVGADSAMVLKNTDLIVNSAEAQIGTLDTTQDSAANNAATGGTLLADGSFTTDDNTRTDFTTVGSVLEVQQGTSGNVLHASGMKLSDATLIKLDAEVGADGQASSDIIKVSGSIDMAAAQTGNSVSPATAPVTARVFVNHLGDAASAAEGARTTIMEGTVASALNEDVLYEVTRSANGTYQRVLQERNVHLENKGDRVDLVYSKNYRSAAKNAQQTAVAGVLQQLSDNFHHSEGTLAASGDTAALLIDAFDYTRSEAAAVRGLQSVAGSGNVLPRLMQFDSSRHHLADLRRQMALPVCPRTDKGGVNRTKNTWITYTCAQDDLGGDAYMGDYSRSAHGFLLGVDRSPTCNLRVGASFGYETASGEADQAKVDGDTLFLDAYAVAVTGQLRHRVSFGLASSSFDSKRGVAVEAGYHSFSGQTKSSADGLTLNFGYELSVEQQLNARSSLARYLSVNLSWHKLDAMKEDGLGNMGLETSYDDEWQADVALGLQYNREFTAVRYEAPATFYATAELHLDLLNDRLSARNRFHGPAADWEVKSMNRDTLYVEFGAGVIVPLSPSWTANAGAAVEVGSEHTSFSGNAGVRYSF